MSYTLIFELTKKEWTDFLALSQIFLVAGIIMTGMNIVRMWQGLPPYSWSARPDRPFRMFPYMILGIGLFASWLDFQHDYIEYTELRSQYEAGQCEINEGKVKNLIRNKSKSDPSVSFDVWPKHYVYRGWHDSPAFQRFSFSEGPIKEGLQVRITDCSGAIVKLEIEKDVPAAQAIVDTPNDPVAIPAVSRSKTQ